MIANPSDFNERPGALKGAFSASMPHPAASMAAADGIEPEEIGGKGTKLYRCIVTGEVKPRDELIRFVISPDGMVTPDLEAVLPGRGYWVTARHNELQRAVAGDLFSVAARHQVKIPGALINTVITLARRSALSTLGLARRDWAVEFGLDNVRQSIISQKAGMVLAARNAPAEVLNKINGHTGDLPVIGLFTTAELSQALGRESLAFVSVNKGQWTVRLLAECGRLAQLLTP